MSGAKIDYEAWIEDQNRLEPDCKDEPRCPLLDNSDVCLLEDVEDFGETSFAELCYYIYRFRMRVRDSLQDSIKKEETQ